MAIRVQCLTCGKRFDAPEKWSGVATACLSCGGTIHVPQRALTPTTQQLEWPAVVAEPLPVRTYQPTRQQVPWVLIVGVALIAFTVGFFSGRAYLAWEQQRAINGIRDIFQNAAQQHWR